MTLLQHPIIDMHCHVGLIGDTWPELGCMSDEYRKTLTYQIFLLYGAPVLLVILLCYTGYSYWVFRGKVTAKSGYH